MSSLIEEARRPLWVQAVQKLRKRSSAHNNRIVGAQLMVYLCARRVRCESILRLKDLCQRFYTTWVNSSRKQVSWFTSALPPLTDIGSRYVRF